MPHLSPMSWTMMFIGSWIIIMLMSINISCQSLTPAPKKNSLLLTKQNWSWYSS